MYPAVRQHGGIRTLYNIAPADAATYKEGIGRAIQPNFPMRRGAWGNLTELSAEYCRLILYTSN